MPNTTFAGNIGKEPELHFTPNGFPVFNFSIGVKADNDREKKPRTTWINVAIWGKKAEIANNILHSGMHVLVKGNAPSLRFYRDVSGDITTSKTGEPGYCLEMVARDVSIIPDDSSYPSIFEESNETLESTINPN